MQKVTGYMTSDNEFYKNKQDAINKEICSDLKKHVDSLLGGYYEDYDKRTIMKVIAHNYKSIFNSLKKVEDELKSVK